MSGIELPLELEEEDAALIAGCIRADLESLTRADLQDMYVREWKERAESLLRKLEDLSHEFD